jgi:hypothetical protein
MFRVEWTRAARNRIAAAWNRANEKDRERIMDALDLIDRLLAKAQLQLGESRDPGVRAIIEAPLFVSFTVNARLRTVRVFSARVFRARS